MAPDPAPERVPVGSAEVRAAAPCDVSEVAVHWTDNLIGGHESGVVVPTTCGEEVDVYWVEPAWLSAEAHEFCHLCIGLQEKDETMIEKCAQQVNAEAERIYHG